MMNRTEDVLVMIAKLRIRSKLNTRCADVPDEIHRQRKRKRRTINVRTMYVPYVGTFAFDLCSKRSRGVPSTVRVAPMIDLRGLR